MIYFDNASTTKQSDEVTKEMLRCMEDDFGNPSSLHGLGLAAERNLKRSRDVLIEKIGAEGKLIFTSGGTEADNMAVIGAARAMKRRGRRVIVSAVEHPAVLESARELEAEGFDVIYLDVDSWGRIDLDMLEASMNDQTILISVMAVNNEVGTVEPIEKIGELKKQALFHTDGVQAFGKMKIPMRGVDMVSISGHKIHGPKGIGALWLRPDVRLTPLMAGGGQEGGMRSGTENVPAIAGFGKATEGDLEVGRVVKERMEEGIVDLVPDIKINSPKDGVPSILNISFLGTRGEVILHDLESRGLYVSTGSACSSNKKDMSKNHVLEAMGLSAEEREGAVRFSFSRYNTVNEAEEAAQMVADAVKRFRTLGKRKR